MSTDRDAVLLSGGDYDTIADAVNEAESAICELLHELHAERNGINLNPVAAVGALMTINTSIRTMLATVNAAGKKPVAS